MDPAVAYYYAGAEVVANVYQGLLSVLPNSTNVVPMIAQNYSVSSDGLTYTFNIRNNVTFSNGDPVNAYVMWYSIYRSLVMNQPVSDELSPAFTGISLGVTADLLNQFNGTTNNVPSSSLIKVMQNPNLALTVTNQYQIVLHLTTRFAPLLAALAVNEAYAVDPQVVSQHGGVQANQTNSWMSLNALGTGPFTVSQYQPSTITELQRNTAYWGGANGIQPTPRLAEVVIKVVPNPLTIVQDLEKGAAQVGYVGFPEVPSISGQPGIVRVNTGLSFLIEYIALDTQKAPLNNLLVRQAIVHALNISAVLPLYGGIATSYVGPTPIGMLGNDPNLQPYSYNVSLSKQLLAEAGYSNGSGLPALTMWYLTDRPPSSDVAQFVQGALAAIGITVNLHGIQVAQEPQLYGIAANSTNHPDMVYYNWVYFPETWAYTNFIVGPICYGGCNIAWYNNTEVNNLLAQSVSTTNTTLRGDLLLNVTHIVYQDAPYIWLAQPEYTYVSGVPFASVSVQGWSYCETAYTHTDFSTLYLVS